MVADRATRGVALGADENTVRFAWLLTAFVLLLLLPPLLRNVWDQGFRLASTVVLVAAVVSVSRHRTTRWVAIVLAIPTVGLDWASLVRESAGLAIFGAAGTLLLLSLVAVALSAAVIRSARVTLDTILGGICVFLLLGVAWTFAYSILEIARPGSILEGGMPISASLPSGGDFPSESLMYFSFVTLTTLGYGDIVPASDAARSLATGEAIVGQLYVAIFVARLVGLHLASARGVQ